MTSTCILPSIQLPRHSPFHPKPHYNLFKPAFHFKSLVCFSSPTNASNSDREEIRWLREEQRWLREEQRWLRERELLLREISALKLQIQALESQNSVKDSSVSETTATMTGLLQVLKEKNLIAESASSSWPLDLGEKREIKEQEKKVVVEEDVRVSGREEEDDKDWKILRMGSEGGQEKNERKALKMGSEGLEVQAMQVCLQ